MSTQVKFDSEKGTYQIKIQKTNLELSREKAVELFNALKEELIRTPPLFDAKEKGKK